MFDMQLPWWEFVVRAAVVYVILLVLVRMSGRRTVGQFTPFDLLVVMLLSESVSNSLNGSDESLSGGLIAAATLIVLNIFFCHHHLPQSQDCRPDRRKARPDRPGWRHFP